MTWLAAAWAALKKLPAWAYGLAGALLALGAAYLRGRASGRASERQAATERALDQRQQTDKLRQEIEALPPGELDKRGEPWVRR